MLHVIMAKTRSVTLHVQYLSRLCCVHISILSSLLPTPVADSTLATKAVEDSKNVQQLSTRCDRVFAAHRARRASDAQARTRKQGRASVPCSK
jgi:hypothetical protein